MRPLTTIAGLSSALLAAVTMHAAHAESFDSLETALRASKATLDLRYRYEHVDDDAFEPKANASTLRARVALRTGSWHGFSALIEAEDIRAPGTDRYNSTANGRTTYPVVADPAGSEWNQAWLAWTSDAATSVTLGRQRVALDNQRFFGNVGFRQNEQTFDALQAMHIVGPLTLRYAYLGEVHRIFGNEHPNRLAARQNLDAHLLNAAWTVPIGTLTGYGYFVENEDLPAASTRDLGLRLTGARGLTSECKLLYTAEVAQQEHWRGGDESISADYALAEIGVSRGGTVAKLGVEVLGGNGTRGFQTPFATLHAFNGWADRFLVTPADGLVDAYLSVAAKLGPGEWVLALHDFDAEQGGDSYGREWDLQYRLPFATHFEFEIKAADYRSDGFGPDVAKLWLALTARY